MSTSVNKLRMTEISSPRNRYSKSLLGLPISYCISVRLITQRKFQKHHILRNKSFLLLLEIYLVLHLMQKD